MWKTRSIIPPDHVWFHGQKAVEATITATFQFRSRFANLPKFKQQLELRNASNQVKFTIIWYQAKERCKNDFKSNRLSIDCFAIGIKSYGFTKNVKLKTSLLNDSESFSMVQKFIALDIVQLLACTRALVWPAKEFFFHVQTGFAFIASQKILN